MILRSDRAVTLVGGGSLHHSHLPDALAIAPCLVAADGGADAAMLAGLRPEAVIGDFDSISPAAQEAFADVLHHVTEQESTDFDKCLRLVEAPFYLALGFLGERLDHTLAAFTSLVTYRDRRCILVGERDICFLAPERLNLSLPEGTRLSLYPMGAVRGEGSGLRWPIAGLDFAPDGRIGTSNMVTGPVALRFDAPRMLVILPRGCLRAALRALTAGALTGDDAAEGSVPGE
ncbi:thiamine diphosphokinase [Halodurantibacterium flavum]|uniref:Thiamine diphosphokinase n=1 Tax=Halodurantibacterium flavum TaxID=1382802 RepID=A0ABW4S477_9RHOB